MNTKKPRIGWIAAAVGTATLVAGGIVASQAAGASVQPQTSVQSATAAPVPAPTATEQPPDHAENEVPVPVPVQNADGDLSTVLAGIASEVLPPGSEQSSAQEYPELHAAMAIYVNGDDAYTLSIQRPEHPASVEEMSAVGTATSTILASGSQQLSIVGPDFEQAVIVRESGLTITVSRTGTASVSARASTEARSSVGSLAESLTAAADSEEIEAKVP
ncbi:hypothetical protein [Microbacterium algeriense]|uniref:hypothetical protein n=1 Tax=Microbacterium algeriense TaxID=2615184 RepID=UPI003D75E775